MIHPDTQFAGALCGLAALVATLPGQETRGSDPRPDRNTARPMVHFVDLDELLGADVVMRASPEARREAREDGETPDRPKGEIDDVLIGSDGRIRWAVIDVGGFLGMSEKSVAVPISALECRPKSTHEATVTVAATEAQLEGLPEIDLDDAEKGDLGATLRAAEASWKSTGIPTGGALERHVKDGAEKEGSGEIARGAERAATHTTRVGAAQATGAANELVRASKIDDWKVRGSDGELGDISKVLVAIDQHPSVAYVILAVDTPGLGSADYLVPYRALTRAKHDDEWVWTLSKSKADVRSGVKYKKPDQGVLDADSWRRADEFFGVKRDAGVREIGKPIGGDSIKRGDGR